MKHDLALATSIKILATVTLEESGLYINAFIPMSQKPVHQMSNLPSYFAYFSYMNFMPSVFVLS